MIPAIASTIRQKMQKRTNKNSFIRENANVLLVNPMYLHSEVSTKKTCKDNFLDYIFSSVKSNLTGEHYSDLEKSKDYLFDLTNTWELNIDLLQNFSLDKEGKVQDTKNEIPQLISQIKRAVDKKMLLRRELKEKKAKILIERQIIEEYKRKIEDYKEFFVNLSRELEEQRNNKEEYIKLFEKNLKEVEIYIHKATKNQDVDLQYKKFHQFCMNEYIDNNTNIVHEKETCLKEILKIKNNIKLLQKENKLFHEEKLTYVEGDKSSKKVKELIKIYSNQINVIQLRITMLKNCFNTMNTTFKKIMLYRRDRIMLTSQDGNITQLDDKSDNEKSIIHFEYNRKNGNYMDFSVILSKKGAEETNRNESKNCINLWDISCITKKEYFV